MKKALKHDSERQCTYDKQDETGGERQLADDERRVERANRTSLIDQKSDTARKECKRNHAHNGLANHPQNSAGFLNLVQSYLVFDSHEKLFRSTVDDLHSCRCKSICQ